LQVYISRLELTEYKKKQIEKSELEAVKVEKKIDQEMKQAREQMHQYYNDYVKVHDQLHREELKEIENQYVSRFNEEKEVIIDSFEKIAAHEKQKIPDYQQILMEKVINE